MTEQPSRTHRFLGGSLLHVLLKLVVLSFLIGLVLAAFGFSAEGMLHAISVWIARLPELGWDTIVEGGRYVALGAIIVVPIWLVVRLLESVRS